MEPLSSLIIQLEGAKRELRKSFEQGNGAEEQKGRAGNVERIGSAMNELLPDLVHRVISRRHTVGFKRVWMMCSYRE